MGQLGKTIGTVNTHWIIEEVFVVGF